MKNEHTPNSKLNLRWLYLPWIGMAFSSLVIGVVSAAFQRSPQSVVHQLGISSFSVFAIALYSIGSAIAVMVLAMLLKKNGLDFAVVGFAGKLSSKGIVFALASLLVAFTLYPVIESILKPIGIPMFWRGNASSALRVGTTTDLALILVFAVLVGPVAEEIIFRGYLVTAFRERMTNLLSVYVLSGLVFASAHVFVGPGTIIFIFFWSFIPAFLFLKFGNLYWPFCFHILNNFVTYVVFPLWLL